MLLQTCKMCIILDWCVYFCMACLLHLTIDHMNDPQKKDLIFKTTDKNPFWGEDFSPYNSKIWFERKHFSGSTT